MCEVQLTSPQKFKLHKNIYEKKESFLRKKIKRHSLIPNYVKLKLTS